MDWHGLLRNPSGNPSLTRREKVDAALTIKRALRQHRSSVLRRELEAIDPERRLDEDALSSYAIGLLVKYGMYQPTANEIETVERVARDMRS